MAHEFSTSWLPGPLYWNMMTGYFLEGSKLAGFTIQPSSLTPSDVVKLNISFLVQPYR